MLYPGPTPAPEARSEVSPPWTASSCEPERVGRRKKRREPRRGGTPAPPHRQQKLRTAIAIRCSCGIAAEPAEPRRVLFFTSSERPKQIAVS